MTKLKRQTVAFFLMIGSSAFLLLNAHGHPGLNALLVALFVLANLIILLTR